MADIDDKRNEIEKQSLQSDEITEIDVGAEDRLRRKLDLLIMPVVTVCYTLTFIDRTNIGNAKSAGLADDLGLHTYDFNIGNSLYYLICLIFEVPLTLLVKRYGFFLIPLSVIGFGAVTIGEAFMTNRAGFYATRILLGLTEAISLPGTSYLLTRYYRRRELTLRMGYLMMTAAGCAGGFGGLLAAGLLSIDSIGSRSGWQNIFLVEGILTIGLGSIAVWIFPTDPERTSIFTEDERRLAIARIFADQPQIAESKEQVNKTLIRRGLLNVTTIACTWIFIVGNVAVQGLGIFLPTVLKLNYPDASSVRIQLLVVPVYAVATTVGLTSTYACVRFRKHWPFGFLAGISAIVGYSIWVATDFSDKKLRYAACFFNMMGGFMSGPVAMGWAGSNASPDTLRAMVGALVSGVGGIGAIAGVWAYVQTDAVTGYHKGNSFGLAMAVSLTVLCISLWQFQRLENKKRDRGERDYRLQKPHVEQLGHLHPSFRYIH